MSNDKLRRLRIRRRVSRARAPKTQAALQISLSGGAVERLLKTLRTPASPEQQPAHLPAKLALRPRLTLRPWVGIIDQILKEDAGLPRRLRTTAMQMWHRLREKHNYPGGYSVIQEYVRQARMPAGTDASPSRRPRRNAPKQSSPGSIDPPRGAIAAPQNVEQDELTSLDGQGSPIARVWPSQRSSEAQEEAFGWMRSVVQGAIPLDILVKQLRGISLAEMEVLRSGATKGALTKRNQSMVVLGRPRGISSSLIASFLQISRRTSFRYWKQFLEGGTETLFARKPRSDKKSNNEFIKSAVFSLLHSPPAAHGFNRTSWKLADLRSVLGEKYNDSISCDTIHTIIKEAGWKWRYARIVLTSNDPEYRAKVDAIKKILSELKRDEAFFSIDEYGPFAIKQKGGIKRVAPGEQYVVPQWQKSKGWLILTAALELSKNQVSYFYSRKKNTDEMIKLTDHLRDQYRTCSTIYLSWDAASWHVSKDLTAYLEKINQEATTDGFPIVKMAPLPAGAQFLNVIESVFSGMARAIIHISNYPSADAAKAAIDRYFAERNEYFTKHPKRAGKKIWGKERVPSVFGEDQNCKDPMYMYPI